MEGDFSESNSGRLAPGADAGGHCFKPSAELNHRAQTHEPDLGSEQDGWRKTFGDLWSSMAVAHGARPIEPENAISTASEVFDDNERRVMALLDDNVRDARGLLIGAATVMESCAHAWGALGPVGGERRVHLLRGLERRLACIESRARCAEQGYAHAAAPSAIHGATLRARGALRLLGRGSVNRAEGLVALEEAALSLAAVAAQGAINIGSFGTTRPLRREIASGRSEELERIAAELARNAHGLRRGAGDRDAGVWLGRCLALRPPHAAMRLSRRRGSDRNLRIEALLAVRASWRRLGSQELLFLDQLEQRRGKPRLSHSPGMRKVVARHAAKLLSQCSLDQRPQMFEHEEAWLQQTLCLSGVVASVWKGLEQGHEHHFEFARRRVLLRLSRVLVAIWAIDAETGFTTPEER